MGTWNALSNSRRSRTTETVIPTSPPRGYIRPRYEGARPVPAQGSVEIQGIHRDETASVSVGIKDDVEKLVYPES
jgi:hypothetical protein